MFRDEIPKGMENRILEMDTQEMLELVHSVLEQADPGKLEGLIEEIKGVESTVDRRVREALEDMIQEFQSRVPASWEDIETFLGGSHDI